MPTERELIKKQTEALKKAETVSAETIRKVRKVAEAARTAVPKPPG